MPIDLETIVRTANSVADTLTGDAAQVLQMVENHDASPATDAVGAMNDAIEKDRRGQ